MILDVHGCDSERVCELVTRSEALRVGLQEAYTQVVNLLADRDAIHEMLGLEPEERYLRVNALFQLHGHSELASCIRERSRLPRSPLVRVLLRFVPGQAIKRFVRWRTDRLALDGLRLLLRHTEADVTREAERLACSYEAMEATIAELRTMGDVVVVDRDPPLRVTPTSVIVGGQRITRSSGRRKPG